MFAGSVRAVVHGLRRSADCNESVLHYLRRPAGGTELHLNCGEDDMSADSVELVSHSLKRPASGVDLVLYDLRRPAIGVESAMYGAKPCRWLEDEKFVVNGMVPYIVCYSGIFCASCYHCILHELRPLLAQCRASISNWRNVSTWSISEGPWALCMEKCGMRDGCFKYSFGMPKIRASYKVLAILL